MAISLTLESTAYTLDQLKERREAQKHWPGAQMWVNPLLSTRWQAEKNWPKSAPHREKPDPSTFTWWSR